MSNNVRPVKSYLSALLLALQRSVLFSLLIDLFIDDQGSRVIPPAKFSGIVAVRFLFPYSLGLKYPPDLQTTARNPVPPVDIPGKDFVFLSASKAGSPAMMTKTSLYRHPPGFQLA